MDASQKLWMNCGENFILLSALLNGRFVVSNSDFSHFDVVRYRNFKAFSGCYI